MLCRTLCTAITYLLRERLNFCSLAAITTVCLPLMPSILWLQVVEIILKRHYNMATEMSALCTFAS